MVGHSSGLDDENKIASKNLMKKIGAPGAAICNILSKIYYSVEDEGVRVDCRKAVYCAKRMGYKLAEYKAQERERTRGKK